MSSSHVQHTYQTLDSIGCRLLSSNELHDLEHRLYTLILESVARKDDEQKKDHELLAAPTRVQHLTQTQINTIPNGAKAIACACGGTNWMFAVATKQSDGSVTLDEPRIRPIPEYERQQTFASLVNMMADEIYAIVQEYDLHNYSSLPIAISFGFPQINVITRDGDIDARLATKQLPKFWRIEDLDETRSAEHQISLTALLRDAFHKKNLHNLASLAMLNDTVCVALDVYHGRSDDASNIPVGFVFGTGINAACDVGNKKGLINLEIGAAQLRTSDDILLDMERKNLVPNHQRVMEYWMGGAYLPSRVTTALRLLHHEMHDAKYIARIIDASHNQAIISDLSQNTLSNSLKLHIDPENKKILQEIARRTLEQAAQCIGVVIVAVSRAVGYTHGSMFVPYEGSLLHKGYNVNNVATETMRLLMPEHSLRPFKASGMTGIAKLALVMNLSKRHTT